MLKSKQEDAWNHTAFIVAQLANCHRDPKKKREPWKARDFHPFIKSKPKTPEQRQQQGKSFIGSMIAAFGEVKES